MYRSSKKMFRLLSGLLIALLFTGALPWRELRADANTHGDYNCAPLAVTYDQNSTWDLNTQGEFVVTNVSEEAVNGWTIRLDFAADLTIMNLWNGQDLRNETTPANTLIIGNEVYNATINPGESINFGLIMTGTEFAPVAPLNVTFGAGEAEPVQIEEEIPQVEIDPSTCVLYTNKSLTLDGGTTTITGDVYTGGDFAFQGSELTVDGTVSSAGSMLLSNYDANIANRQENVAPATMPDLSEEIFARADELTALDMITDTTSGGYLYVEESMYLPTDIMSGEYVIVAEDSITINAEVIPPDCNLTLYSINGNITIYSYQASFSGTLYAPAGKVTFNADEITIAGRIIADEFEFNRSSLTITNDPAQLPEVTPEVTSEPTEIPEPTELPTPTPEEPVDETLDSDEDGILDYQEIEIGTNPNDPDTDGDGLDDYLEIMLGYDPVNQDTDGNGVLDGEEDFDQDGINNVTEISLDLNFMMFDSDEDRLSDGAEVNTYGTDPKDPDSDDDGILDGDEVLLGKDPSDSGDATTRVEQTAAQEIVNEEDPAISSVEVTLSLANSIDSSLTIRDEYNINMHTTNVPGRIGSPLSFECEEDFDTATVVIHYSESALSDTAESDLGILWYDEANGVFVEQEQAVIDSDNNTVTVVLEHFSRYVLVDIARWRSILPTAYLADDVDSTSDGYSGFDVFFMVELNDRMTDADKATIVEYIDEIIDMLQDGDRCYFMIYGDGYDTVYCNFEYYTSLSGIPAGVRSQIFDFQGIPVATAVRMRNMMTAAGVDIGHDILTLRISNNLQYSGISGDMWGGVSQWYAYHATSPRTNYDVYGATMDIRVDNTEAMNDISNLLGSYNTSVVDVDNDGIPDFLEEEGMYGIDGTIYYSSADPETGYDTDGDSISDGEEMGTMYTIRKISSNSVKINNRSYSIASLATNQYRRLIRFIPENVGEVVYVFDVVSNPNCVDSDYDSLLDFEEDTPLAANPHINYIFYSNYDSESTHNDYIAFTNEVNFRTRWFVRNGLNYRICISNSVGAFVRNWNAMGSVDGTTYIIDDVYIIAHGGLVYGEDGWNGYGIVFGADATTGITYHNFVDMNDKSISNLYIESCWSANTTDRASSIASEFLNYFDIDNVYGCDGHAVVDFWYSYDSFGDNFIQFGNRVSNRSQYNQGNALISFTGFGDNVTWKLVVKTGDMFADGFYRYYIDDSGSITRAHCPNGELVWTFHV
ncbi:Cellulose binding domain-containing protein [Oscillospiraceae bacterium]|nr:Cellulose binding domain-containing protein [Oscillospiraceae bacterium]